MVQLSAISCSGIAILWVSVVSFAAITICVASHSVFIVVAVYFVVDSVRKLLDTPSYTGREEEDYVSADQMLSCFERSVLLLYGQHWHACAVYSEPSQSYQVLGYLVLSLVEEIKTKNCMLTIATRNPHPVALTAAVARWNRWLHVT
jgi:hypothetical protein